VFWRAERSEARKNTFQRNGLGRYGNNRAAQIYLDILELAAKCPDIVEDKPLTLNGSAAAGMFDLALHLKELVSHRAEAIINSSSQPAR